MSKTQNKNDELINEKKKWKSLKKKMIIKIFDRN